MSGDEVGHESSPRSRDADGTVSESQDGLRGFLKAVPIGRSKSDEKLASLRPSAALGKKLPYLLSMSGARKVVAACCPNGTGMAASF
jgi:hypothetical protein